MINVSSAFKEELNKDNRKYIEHAKITLVGGTVLNLTNDNIWSGGFSIEDTVSNDNVFEVGAVIINRAVLTINNIYGTYDSYDFLNATVELSVGLMVNGTEETVRKGKYTVVDQPKYNGALITIECLDNMYKFDIPYERSTLQYPASLDTIVRDACTVAGVMLNTYNFSHKSHVIQERPDNESTTIRDVLSWAAQISGCFARCNNNGQLELKWYDRTALSTKTGNIHRISSLYKEDVSVDDVVITGVRVSAKPKVQSGSSPIVSYLQGTEGYVVDISNNPFITPETMQTIAGWIGVAVISMRFRKANFSHSSDPSIEAGDVALITDRKNKQYPIVISRTKFVVGAAQNSVSAAENPARNSAARYSTAVKNYVSLHKQLQAEKTERERIEDDLRESIENAGGMYETQVPQPGGGVITYIHNKPDLDESDTRIMISDVGVTVTPDGGQHWYGLTVNGDLIARILSVTGIHADWINTGQLVVRKNGVEMLFADIDTGTVRISGNAVSITSGDNLDNAINNSVKKNAYGVNILRGTNTVTALTTSGKWNEGKWRSASSGTGIRSSHAISVSPQLNIFREWRFTNASNTTDKNTDIGQDEIPVVSGKKYTFSCYVKGTGKLIILYGWDRYVNKQWTVNAVTSWQRISWTITMSSASSGGKYLMKNGLTRVFFGNRAVGTLNVCGMMMELGDVLHDYNMSEADGAVKSFNETLTQQEIFNKLTNNGATQGIYLNSGKLYINGSYIQSGVISANYLKAGVISDKGSKSVWNLDKSTMNLNLDSLVLSAPNFSIAKNGTVTAKNATIEGLFKMGNYNNGSYFEMSNGKITCFYKKTNLGFIGTNEWNKNANHKGIVFDLETAGYYMAWGYRELNTDKQYTVKWTYAAKATLGYVKDTLNAGCDIDMNWHKIKNISGTVNGTFNLIVPKTINKDGTLKTWSYGCYLKFQDGLLVKAVWPKTLN